jgi:hypothetical protein
MDNTTCVMSAQHNPSLTGRKKDSGSSDGVLLPVEQGARHRTGYRVTNDPEFQNLL